MPAQEQHRLNIATPRARLRRDRRRQRTRALRSASIVIGFGLACLGCSWGHRHYKPQLPAPWRLPCVEYESYFDANDMALCKGASLASNICIQGGGLSVGVVEFDDEGTHWDRRQLQRLEEEIRAVGAAQASAAIPTRGILLMAFVHGWGNSGSEGSSALLDFRKIARYVAGSSGICHGHGRPSNATGSASCESRPYVVAVYLAWHGDSLGLNSVYAKTRTRETDWLGALRMPTFWARKSAAQRAGGTPMTETLLRLLGAVEAVDGVHDKHTAERQADSASRPRSRSLLIGHSLGAGVVEQAFAPVVVTRRMERNRLAAHTVAADHLPNLVVLLNPATEALSATNLIEAMEAMETVGARSPDESRQPPAPRVVSIASSTDRVTRRIFPGGVYFGRALTLRPTNRMRANTRFGDYGKLVTHSAAHHREVRSHWLLPETCTEGVDAGIPFRVQDQPYRLCRAEKPPFQAPYWVFTVPPELLPDHRDVFTPSLFDFILALMRYQPGHRW